MKLTQLSLYNFRNINELTFDCNDSVNCIIGKNGVGKTNILDAIYYLSFCKSNLISKDELNVRHGETAFAINGTYDVDDVIMKVSCAYDSTEKNKIVKCNDKKYTRFADHIGLLPLVFVSPSDISLITDGSVERRKFLDSYISMYNHEYLNKLLSYNKLLQQRNAMLKEPNGFDETYLSILDDKLSMLGTAIFQVRQKAVAELSERTKKFYTTISSTEETGIIYESQLQNNDMKFLLDKNYERDKFLSYTSVGIHRDDLLFTFDNELLKNVASQGQKKSFLLALKFAQYQLTKEFKNGQKPILLLDDLFDKLDKTRANNIFNIVEQEEFGQIFITDTDKMLLSSIFEQKKSRGVFWNLEDGKIIKL